MKHLPRHRTIDHSPAIRDELNRLMNAVELGEGIVWPLARTGTEGGGSGFESREPGHTECAWLPGELERIIAQAADRAERACAKAHPRDAYTPPESVGGVAIVKPEVRGEWEDGHTLDVKDGKLVARRRNARGTDGKFKPGAQMTHLAGKLADAIGQDPA